MGKILKRRTQEDSENSQHGRLEVKRKQKVFKLKGVTKENKSPTLGKKSPVVGPGKRMALVDKTNKSSHRRDLIVSKDGHSERIDALNTNKLPVKVQLSEGVIVLNDTEDPPGSSNGEKNSESLKENRAPPRYRVSPVERPVTRSRKHPPNQCQEPSKGSETGKRKDTTKRKREHDGKYSTNKAVTDENTTPVRGTLKSLAVPSRGTVLAERIVKVTSSRRNDVGVGSNSTYTVLESKDVNITKDFKGKHKQAGVRKKDNEVTAVEDDHHTKETVHGTEPTKDLCDYCRKIKGTCSCHVVIETPLSSYSSWKSINEAPRQLERIQEVPENKSSPLLDPTPGSSRSPGVETPYKKSRKSASDTTKASPKESPLFSCFKKPDTLHRNPSENKIFVSGSKQSPSKNLRNRNPVYANKNLTPLKQRNSLVDEMKMFEFEFEVDENEPKPKKKQRRIMKIQRVRAHKPKKPKVYVSDPEMEMRVLRNLDLSPSVLDQIKGKRMEKVNKPQSNHPSTSAACIETPLPCNNLHTDNLAEGGREPSSDGGIYDVDMDHHGDYDPCHSSPCSKYGSSTPLQNAYDGTRDSLLDESIHRFGGLSAKVYSPVKSKASPIPVLLENFNNDPVRSGNSDRRSASNVSLVSCNTSYQHDLDISASTPVKFRKHDSTPVIAITCLEPEELNISNCFGFDEPQVMEEPLVSPIKTIICVAPPPASPARSSPIVRKKPLVEPPAEPAPVHVEEVIQQLRSEVGDNSAASTSLANVPLFEDTEVSPRKGSPMKHYLLSKANAVLEKPVEDVDSDSDSIPTTVKIPKLSYVRPNLRRRVVIAEPTDLNQPSHSAASDDESDSDNEETDLVEIPIETEMLAYKAEQKPKHTPRKKGMTKKDEEELEKWVKMFNLQCQQVSNYGLCVE